MKGSNMQKAIGGMLSLLLLVGCGQLPGTSLGGSDANSLDASAKSKFKYALGADVSDDPGVTLDESFDVQALPTKVDLRKDMSPVRNQGQFGSCTSFATMGLQEFLLKKQGRFTAQAPAFNWYQSRRQTGSKGKDDGVPTEFAVKMLDAYGSVPESDFPYLASSKQNDETARLGFLTAQPSSELTAKGKKNRILTGYKSVTTLSGVKKGLSDGTPVVLAMYVFSNMGSTPKSGLLPMPTSKDKFEGGHAVLAVGYDNEKRVIIVRNSWGSDWADGGYFYMPYEYLKYGGVRLAIVPKI
jgi:C1A family cysteine protease